MIIVTGGTGLLGSHLLFYLLRNPEIKSLRASFRSEEKIEYVKKLFSVLNLENESVDFKKIEWIKADLSNPFDVSTLLQDATHVYHCAARVSFFTSDFSKLLKDNREITALIVNSCIDIPSVRLCYVSSTAAIGSAKNGLTNEHFKWQLTKQTSAYSISKHLAEKEVWRGIEEGLNAVIINPCVILGAGNWNESSLTILKSAAKGMPFYTPGGNAIVDARDVAICMIKLMNSPIKSERFLCTGENIRFFDLFKKIAQRMNKNSPKIKVPYVLARFVAFINENLQYFSSTKKGLTKDTVNSSFKTISYSSEKLVNSINHRFYTLDETIDFSLQNRML